MHPIVNMCLKAQIKIQLLKREISFVQAHCFTRRWYVWISVILGEIGMGVMSQRIIMHPIVLLMRHLGPLRLYLALMSSGNAENFHN